MFPGFAKCLLRGENYLHLRTTGIELSNIKTFGSPQQLCLGFFNPYFTKRKLRLGKVKGPV